MRRAMIVAGLAVALYGHQVYAEGLSELPASKLVKYCESEASKDVTLRFVCLAYLEAFFSGAFEFQAAPQAICVKEGAGPERFRLGFLAFVRDHPKMLDEPTFIAVEEMLREQFACPAAKP